MLTQVIGKKTLQLGELALPAGAKVIVELGAGDGKFAYRYAQAHPDWFILAIEPDRRALEGASRKASAKPARGGLQNLVYLAAFAEDLPDELASIADTVFINFPWGSLLAGTVLALPEFVSGFARLLRPNGKLQVLLTYDARFEPETVSDLALPELTDEALALLAARYREYGLEMVESLVLTTAEFDQWRDGAFATSWWKRIRERGGRDVRVLQFRRQ